MGNMAPSPLSNGLRRPIARVALVLLALSTPTVAASGKTPRSPLAAELKAQEKQRRIVEDLLGPDRWRHLDAARFRIGLRDHPFTPELAADPDLHDEVAGILMRSIGRMAQKGLQRRFRLYERRDALRARLRASDGRRSDEGASGRAGLDVSPRLRLGDRPWVGAKLRLRGTGDGFWSRTSLRLGSELDGSDPSVKLAFKGWTRRGFLAYHPDHPRRGEVLELQIGLSF